MAYRIKPEILHEMSIVLAKAADGTEFAPRNPEARVLAVKAKDKSLVEKAKTALDALKAYFVDAASEEPEDIGVGYPVSVDVPDNIDNDGDGADDYNAICSAICAVACDLQSACAISDDDARSAAVVKAIDSFLDGLDDLRGGEDAEKAGARHSAADLASLQSVAEAHAEIAKRVDAIGGALKDLGITGAEGPVAARTGPEQDEGPDSSQSDDDDSAEKAGKEPYGDVNYADPGYQSDKKKRYPLDTEEHVRAAASYFGMEKNRSQYSEDEQKKIQAKIDAAKKKFGIGDESKKAEVDMTQEQIDALVAEAASKAAEAAVAKANEANTAAIEKAKADAKAEAEAKLAEAEKARAASDEAAEKARQDAAAARETLKAAAGMASSQSSLSAAVDAQRESSIVRRFKAEMRNNPVSHTF